MEDATSLGLPQSSSVPQLQVFVAPWYKAFSLDWSDGDPSKVILASSSSGVSPDSLTWSTSNGLCFHSMSSSSSRGTLLDQIRLVDNGVVPCVSLLWDMRTSC